MLVLQLIIKFYQKIERNRLNNRAMAFKKAGFGEEFPVDNIWIDQKIEEQKIS